MKAIEAVLKRNWAIMPDALDTIAVIAERENEYHGNLEALAAKLGRPLGNTMSATVRDGVAIIPVEGSLFAKANMMTEFSGATSYDMLARDFTAAVEDPMVSAIILNIDSPGGEVTGASELSSLIRNARGTKPITAFVSGTGASAAYWIASAADKIIAADTAIVGSIGVQSGFTVRDPKPGEKSYRFVSSQSPNKNPSPETEAGSKQMQQTVDSLAKVFVETVATNRGTTYENVLESYGQGAVFVANEALERGMIDGIGTFESLLTRVTQEIESMDYSTLTASALAEHRPDLVAEITAAAVAGVEKVDADALRAEGAKAERDRIAGIEALAMPGTEAIVAELKADASVTPEAAAIRILQAVKAGAVQAPATANDNGAYLAGLKVTEQALETPAAGNAGNDQPTIDDAAKEAIAMARQAGIAV